MPTIKIAVLRFARFMGLFGVARVLTRKKLRILCYHGFALSDDGAFRPTMFMDAGRFRQRLEYLRRKAYSVLPLAEALQRIRQDTLPENAVVITFDDGFRSVPLLAAPLLAEYRYPATVYVTTYYVGKQKPVFTLAVQYMFWKTTVRKLAAGDLPWIADKVQDWDAPDTMDRIRDACIDWGEAAGSETTRNQLCARLGELLGVPWNGIVEAGLFTLMNEHELRALAAQGFDIQLHTHRHRFPGSDRPDAEREIADNRRALAAVVPGAKTHFCYPSGEWSRRQWAWLDAMGVESSTTCEPGLNSSRTPRHALHRILDSDTMHELEFEASLSGFADCLRAVRPRWRLNSTPSDVVQA